MKDIRGMRDLIDSLEDLRVLLKKKPIPELGGLLSLLDNSGVERTTGLKQIFGAGCPYYRKSKELFLSKDYDKLLEEVKKLDLSPENEKILTEVKQGFRSIEGPSFNQGLGKGL